MGTSLEGREGGREGGLVLFLVACSSASIE